MAEDRAGIDEHPEGQNDTILQGQLEHLRLLDSCLRLVVQQNKVLGGEDHNCYNEAEQTMEGHHNQEVHLLQSSIKDGRSSATSRSYDNQADAEQAGPNNNLLRLVGL